MEIERTAYHSLTATEPWSPPLCFISSSSFAFNSCSYLAVHASSASSSSANKLSSSLEELLSSQTAARFCAFSISTSGMKFISESSESKLVSDSEAEDILIFWRKFGRFRAKIYKSKYDVPRKQREMTEGWSIRFLGRRHSLARPRLPQTRSCNTSSTTLAGRRKSRIQPNSKIFSQN